jgi:hypothetical protein
MEALTEVAIAERPLDRGSNAQRHAARVALIMTVGSRVLIWCTGVVAVSVFGAIIAPGGLTLPGVNSNLGLVADRLTAPIAHWDASWYLLIAQHGYQAGALSSNLRMAFFPLYPLTVSALGWTGMPLVAAGALISTACLGLALYGLHLLTQIEYGEGAASDGTRVVPTRPRASDGAHPSEAAPAAPKLAVAALALCPMAVFFSAVYSDSLYLALSVGAFLYARRGRWTIACTLAALGAATRATGVLLALPLAVFYLYGPRADRPPDRVVRPGTRARKRLALLRDWRWVIPRYRLRRDVAWLAIVPLGLLAFMAYLGLNGSSFLAPFHVENAWGHHLAGPIEGIRDGAVSAYRDLRALLNGHLHFATLSTDPTTGVVTGWQNVMPFAFLLLTVPAIVGVARSLPIAYLLYVLAAVGIAISEPVTDRPLQSLPRYEAVLFPLFMWFGFWLARHRLWRVPILLVSAILAAWFAAEYATWHFVA